MTSFQTVGLTLIVTFFMATFTAMANFVVNRYAPKIAEHIERRIKKETK